MQAEQSFVGKVLSNWAMTPPMLISLSTRNTFIPELARSSDAWMPAIPDPTTMTAPTLSLSFSTLHPFTRIL